MKNFVMKFVASVMWPMRLVLFLGISTVVGVIGPFGTFGLLELPSRLIYWGIIVFISYALISFLRFLVKNIFPNLSFGLVDLGAVFLLSLALPSFILMISKPFIPAGPNGYEDSWKLPFFVFFVGILVMFVRYTISVATRGQGRHVSSALTPRLFDRIPVAPHGKVLQISAKNHHIKVRTTQGVCEIRMRLADAIKEMEGVDGVRTHRSHWVAISAVSGHGSNGKSGTSFLILIDGTRVPVSRKFEPEVEKLGLL